MALPVTNPAPSPPPSAIRRLPWAGVVLVVAISAAGMAIVAGLQNFGGEASPTPTARDSGLLASAKYVAYRELLDNAEEHEGELVRFARATVIEFVAPGVMILSTRRCGQGCWEDAVYVVGYQGDPLFEDDVVELIGTSRRLAEWGRFPMPSRAIPRIDAASIALITRPGPD